MLSNRTLSEEQTLIRRHFTDFFESERNEDKYQQRIQEMMTGNKERLIMDMGDLLDFASPAAVSGGGEMDGTGDGAAGASAPSSLGAGIIRHPGQYLPLLELSLHDVVLRLQPEYLKVDYRSRAVHVGFEGPVGAVLSPRELYARHLNTMVALEGIITRQSSNRPRVLQTVHYCRETNKFSRKEFRDQLTPMIDSSHLPTVNTMPKTDMEGNALRAELGLSTFVDSQCAVLQESPERAPTGQLPRNVELRFDDDLVDTVKPGDRVLLVGVYMPYTTADSKSFHSIILVNHIVSTQACAVLTRSIPSLEDRLIAFARRCTEQGGSPTAILRTLSRAIAPAIYGLQNEKQAVLLMLVGGVERQAHNTHIRGDINVLLVGEPSTAKSQLLRFVLGVAPLALSTTGKGSSGVGLTAAVAVDSYTGERSLSAGAMVLADRGILCIDEFDKMSAQDRVAMHEAMEQQTVTIAKAGIHASLNARCSVLAAANPIYGFYSVHHRLAFNVGLPESLLSRFDLTFIVLDQHSSAYNRRIGKHILRNHMTSAPVGVDQVTTKTVVESAESAWVRQMSSTGGFTSATGEHDRAPDPGMLDLRMTTNSSGESIVSVDFLRSYIQMAKRAAPKLTETAQQLIAEHYVQLRAEQQEGTKDGFYITARTLEAIVRLSTAHAKIRLSELVEDVDVHAAMELLRASVHAAVSAAQKREEDNKSSLEDARPHRKRGLETLPSHDESGATAPRTRSENAPSEMPLPEGAAAQATPSRRTEGDPTSQNLARSIIDALKSLQREHRSSVSVQELRERLGNGVPLSELQQALSQMGGDAFVFEQVEGGDGGFVQLL